MLGTGLALETPPIVHLGKPGVEAFLAGQT